MKRIAPAFFTSRRAAGTGSVPGDLSPGAGQAAEFRRVILPHLDAAYNLARYLTRDPVLAEDVAQEAVLRAFRAFGQFRGASPRAWLLAIVRNCCFSAQARGGSAVGLVVHESSLSDEIARQVAEHPDPGPTPEEAAQSQDDVARVRAAIEAIPEPFREAVVLRDLEDLTYAEIAEVTGVPIGTVMSRLARGRAMLAKQLLPAAKADDEQARSAK
jgi:RNA polymerase sigma factor (sigma-70 family)